MIHRRTVNRLGVEPRDTRLVSPHGLVFVTYLPGTCVCELTSMEFLERRRSLVETRIEELVTSAEGEALAEEMGQITLSGGKRVRPLLTVLVCEAAGGAPEDALDFAAGIELVHSASLVVDDIIDRSPLRRGVDSAWTAFGHGRAIVASDGLIGEAFALFSTDPRAMEAVSTAMIALGEGEASELAAQPTTHSEYRTLARRKTGALFRAAAELGAIAADADPETTETFGEYAERLGIAFQIRDDVLDATADAETIGKPAEHDAAVDRPSIVRVTDQSATEATAQAEAEATRALDALARIDTRDEQAVEYLQELAGFVVTRDR